MSDKSRWRIAIALFIIAPLLQYSLFPIFGTTINAVSFIPPMGVTFLLGLRLGIATSLLGSIFTWFVCQRFVDMPTQEIITKGLLANIVCILLCIGADISRKLFFLHRKAQSDLEDTEENYRLIFENSAEGIICVDNEARVTDANARAAALLNLPVSALRSMSIRRLEIFSGEFQKRFDELLKSKKKISLADLTGQLHSANDTSRTLDISVSNIQQHGKPTRWILMLKDTTAQRKMEAQLQESKRMESIGRLAGGIAHDMNNILNAIVSASFALKSQIKDMQTTDEDFDTIDHACSQGAQLTRNLLGFARKSDIRHEIFSVNDVVDSVLSIIHRTAPRSIHITTHLSQPPIVMEGDSGQIESALMNLCLNALDAMGSRGTIEIKTEAHDSDFSLSISDSGAGIDASVRDKMFEPFFTTKPVGKGTGLGLAMVYAAVKNHGGKISVKSTPGVGTTMKITFRRYTADIGTVAIDSRRPLLHRDVALKGKTVLLVDDDPIVLRSSKRMISTLGANVLTANNGTEALTLYERHQLEIQLLVIDLVMPDMDGAQVLKQIRTLNTQVPAIIVSGYSAEPEKLKQLKTEVARFDFLNKPYRAHELLHTIDRLGLLPSQRPANEKKLLRYRTNASVLKR
ncbi:MAG: response regulator [Deltaproteobacteria bacterium]|nr:response regulator [Deltaproteobacteria bacterium]